MRPEDKEKIKYWEAYYSTFPDAIFPKFNPRIGYKSHNTREITFKTFVEVDKGKLVFVEHEYKFFTQFELEFFTKSLRAFNQLCENVKDNYILEKGNYIKK